MAPSFASTSAAPAAAPSPSSAAAAAAEVESASRASGIPVLSSLAELRAWRRERFAKNESVGFVPTMGALHQGHLDLVRTSLRETHSTIVSIYVNPAQFAPSEDLSSYPRTLPSDLSALASLSSEGQGSSFSEGQGSSSGVAAVFAPSSHDMYPNGIEQDKSKQRGAFIEVAGLQDHMEGKSRPTFFRGVATVVAKLFNAVQPDLAYFGQKDIQQAIILRRLTSDLLFAYPPGPSAVRVLPTSRAPDGLALSSRNVYLTPTARAHATALHSALSTGQRVWNRGASPKQTIVEALKVLSTAAVRAAKEGVIIETLYISLNDPVTLEPLRGDAERKEGQGAILSGAAMISEGPEGRKTRLIDNLLLGFELQ